MVESGEAVRLGDPQADTKKTSTSLRIKAGQIFGAEEVSVGRAGRCSRGQLHMFFYEHDRTGRPRQEAIGEADKFETGPENSPS